MKVIILFPFQSGPWGGANQFLKALRKYFIAAGCYAEEVSEAGIILFNSHHSLQEVSRLKRKYPEKIFVHRVDGPIQIVRGIDAHIDEAIFFFNQVLADATIFQTTWSKDQSCLKGLSEKKHEIVIHNAPDPNIFFPSYRTPAKKKKLIAASWSSNERKGFDFYRYIDKHLDFNRFEMTFVGNSPAEFENIRMIEPKPSEELAEILRDHDIFITASKNDPCSNALLEALHCGLPALVHKSGGSEELLKNGGLSFKSHYEGLLQLESLEKNFEIFRTNIEVSSLEEIGSKYLIFFKKVLKSFDAPQYSSRKIHLVNQLKLNRQMQVIKS